MPIKVLFIPCRGNNQIMFEISNLGQSVDNHSRYTQLGQIKKVLVTPTGLSFFFTDKLDFKTINESLLRSLGNKIPMDFLFIALTEDELGSIHFLLDQFTHTPDISPQRFKLAGLISQFLLSFFERYLSDESLTEDDQNEHAS
jgi:hypothetical protein